MPNNLHRTVTVEQVTRMHALSERGLATREIAEQLGVSTETVRKFVNQGRVVREDSPRSPNYVAPARCPTCGHLVRGPCRECRVEREKEIQRAIRRGLLKPSA